MAFDVTTDPSLDQVLTNLRYSQAASQLPSDVVNQGVTVKKSVSSPLGVFVLYSPKGTYDPLFLANYAYVNINDPMTRVPGVGQVIIFGPSKYAVRVWVNPDKLAKLDITVNEITSALQAQNTVNPAGQLGGDPTPSAQEFTFTVRAQGRLASLTEFENVVVRAKPDGSLVRLKDVGRVELGAQDYVRRGRLNGKPAVIVAIYQLPGSNAIETMRGATKLMDEMKARFPADLDYVTALDTTLAVSEGMKEIVKTLVEALILVVIVVFIFLQGFRATLIPTLAVPVALVGTFMVFPLLGFSINTLSLFGLVLAIGLVVDDAIVVVEAVEHHIEKGLSPRDAAFKAMEQVSGPVVAIALILAAVFVPTAFIPGITGRMYQQFAVTIAVSVLLSAFNALTLSPALCALLLRPRTEMRGPLGAFFRGFNRWFARATDRYVGACGHLIRKSALSMVLLGVVVGAAGLVGSRLPGGFVPEEDQGYVYVNVQLPLAASLDRTAAVSDKLDEIFKTTPGIKYYTGIAGFSLLSQVTTTYNGFYFITLDDWAERNKEGLTSDVIIQRLNMRLAGVAEAQAFAFSPPAIPGIGTSGGVTFMLEDRSGGDPVLLGPEHGEVPGRCAPTSGVRAALHDAPAQHAAVLRGGRSRQGAQAGDPAVLGVPGAADVPGRRVRELLQRVRARLAGLRPGRGRVPHAAGERRAILRAQCGGAGGAAVHAGHHARGERARVHHALQRVPLGADQRHPGARLQHAAGHARAGASVRRTRCRGAWASTTQGCRSRRRRPMQASRPPRSSASRCWWCSCCWPRSTRAGSCRSACCSARPSPCSARSARSGWAVSS